MTPLRKAAIAFREAHFKHNDRNIIILLKKKKLLELKTDFLKKYFATPDKSDEEIPFENAITEFVNKVIKEGISEEELTDWQQEIIQAINIAINESKFQSIFEIDESLTSYNEIKIAIKIMNVVESRGLFKKVIQLYLREYGNLSKNEVIYFLTKVLDGNFKENTTLESLEDWQQQIILNVNSLSFLQNFRIDYLDLYSYLREDISEIESLLSNDEIYNDDEAIISDSFNIPYDKKYIQGNRIHKELAKKENAYKKLFYAKRSEEAKQDGNSNIEGKYRSYVQTEEKIVDRIEEIDHYRSVPVEEREGLFLLLSDKRSIDQQVKEVHKKKDSGLTDQWGDKEAYPNLATAKLSYIGKDGKLHIKSIKSSHLSSSKKVAQYKSIGTHSEGQVFAYVDDLVTAKEKYKQTPKIVVDMHTKMDMCAMKKIGRQQYTDKDTCTKLACELTTKYPKIAIRVSYDLPHGYGQKDYNYLCHPCKHVIKSWATEKIKPTNSMLQQRILDKPKYEEGDIFFDEIISSSGGMQYSSSTKKVQTYNYQKMFNFILADDNLHVVEAGAGGNCFFHTIARQLEVKNGQKIITHAELRQFAIQYMKMEENKEKFKDFVEGNIDDYIEQMSQNGTWADNPIIQALANEFNFEIVIYRINGAINLISGNNPIRTVSIAYTGAHYLSVETIDTQAPDEHMEYLVQAMGASTILDQDSLSIFSNSGTLSNQIFKEFNAWYNKQSYTIRINSSSSSDEQIKLIIMDEKKALIKFKDGTQKQIEYKKNSNDAYTVVKFVDSVMVACVTNVKYDNEIFNNGELLHKAYKLSGIKAIDFLYNLEKNKDVANQLLIVLNEFDFDKVLELIKTSNQKEKQTVDVENSTFLKTQDEQTLEAISSIESIIGKEALVALTGWHQYISKALSNNPFSNQVVKLIQEISNLVDNLEEWLDWSFAYDDGAIDTKVTVLLTQLENLLEFVGSGHNRILPLPPRYPDFDQDDYGGGGSGGGSYGDNNEHANFNHIDFSSLFIGYNVTTSHTEDIL